MLVISKYEYASLANYRELPLYSLVLINHLMIFVGNKYKSTNQITPCAIEKFISSKEKMVPVNQDYAYFNRDFYSKASFSLFWF
jgi:hypothetical protein